MREAESTVALVLLTVLATIDGQRAAPRGAPPGPLGRLADTVRDRMLDVVNPDEIVERLDVNALLDRVDVNRLIDRIDVEHLVARIDVDALVHRVDVTALLDRVDVDDLLDRVDVNAALDRVDVNRLLGQIDVDDLLDRVDVDDLLDRVDVNRLADRVEPGRLLDRMDVDALLERVDVERLVRRAGVPEIVAESTGSVAESALDLLRRQLLGLDVVISRAVVRLTGRGDESMPAGPPLLVDQQVTVQSPRSAATQSTTVTGHYAGPVTRLVAYLLDVALASGVFTFTLGALSSLLDSVGVPVGQLTGGGALFVPALFAWLFLYWWAGSAVAGRTPGMAVVGLRIVTRSGLPLSGRRAFIRVLVLPFSIAVLGLGLIGVVVDRERRGLHDLAAGSTVVYDWGDRAATLPTPLARWLARHAALSEAAAPPSQGPPPPATVGTRS